MICSYHKGFEGIVQAIGCFKPIRTSQKKYQKEKTVQGYLQFYAVKITLSAFYVQLHHNLVRNTSS